MHGERISLHLCSEKILAERGKEVFIPLKVEEEKDSQHQYQDWYGR